MKTIQFYSYIVFGLITALFAGYQFHVYNLKKSAQQDIDFMHQAFLENHPGVYNDQDPNFVHNMNTAYQEATHAIQSMKSSYDHEMILKEYLKTFHDTHVRFFSKAPKNRPAQKREFIDFSINSMPNGIIWITLPTFQPNKDQQKELENIIDELPHYQKSKLIVFDLRNNTGGNSDWGIALLKNLFGEEYVTQKLYALNKNIEVDWRASKDNIAHLTYLVDYIKDQFGAKSSQALEFKTIEEGMQQAYKEHKVFYTEYSSEYTIPTTKEKNSVTAKIAAITSSRCVSACLDFIDGIKAVDPKALLIGQTTDADTVYIEVREIDLPSGLGKIQFPIKMYRNRPRGNNVPYIPNISYPADINSEEEKNEWLLETIKKLSTID